MGATKIANTNEFFGVFAGDWTDQRKDLIFLARTAEAAERHGDMCVCMKKVVNLCKANSKDMTVDERNLLSVAYKNVIGSRRASWRTLNGESKDESNGNLISTYQKKLENELKNICNNVLDLLDKNLIEKDEEKTTDTDKEGTDTAKEGEGEPDQVSSNSNKEAQEAQVFYLKMAGDYNRYLAETLSGNQYQEASSAFYKKAFLLSEKVLEPTHPIRLGLGLNYSVCYYEILGNKKAACELAKSAFDAAIEKLDKLNESDYKDSTLIMQLLRDNLTLWTSSTVDDEDNEEGGGD